MRIPATESGKRGAWFVDVAFCVLPPIIALHYVIALRAIAYIQISDKYNAQFQGFRAYRRPPSIAQAVGHVWRDFLNGLENGGAMSGVLLLINYVAAFGALAACCLILRRFTTSKRLWCFWLVGLGVLLGFAQFGGYRSQTEWAWGHLIIENYETHYWEFLLSYPIFAVPIALVVAWLTSLLPMLKPGKRYWLKRGMCPKCHYDLKGDTQHGCPECGWNRPKVVSSGPAAAEPSASSNTDQTHELE